MDDHFDYSRNRQNEHLGVNKIGKNIRKSPIHQPNFAYPARPPPQPQVYNINKNDFRNVVQQLTGSPLRHSHEPGLTRSPQNSPKPPSMRLQRIRPPPLAPLNVNRPQMPPRGVGPRPTQYGQPRPRGAMVPPPVASGDHIGLGNTMDTQYGRPPPRAMVRPPVASADHTGLGNTMESPISAYMRYLQHSVLDPTQGHPQARPQYPPRPQVQSQMQSQQQPLPGLLPHPHARPLPSPRMNGLPPLPSPRMNGFPPLLPSPTSPFVLPSPSGYLNLLSPRSPYPLLSPGYQHPPPLTPNFLSSPMAQSGILGPGPQPPPSPGMGFPFSPGFFQMLSPRWRD